MRFYFKFLIGEIYQSVTITNVIMNLNNETLTPP